MPEGFSSLTANNAASRLAASRGELGPCRAAISLFATLRVHDRSKNRSIGFKRRGNRLE